jgi:hypothetical protein
VIEVDIRAILSPGVRGVLIIRYIHYRSLLCCNGVSVGHQAIGCGWQIDQLACDLLVGAFHVNLNFNKDLKKIKKIMPLDRQFKRPPVCVILGIFGTRPGDHQRSTKRDRLPPQHGISAMTR